MSSRACYVGAVTPWRMLLIGAWCALVVFALVLLGQWAGLIDSGALRQVVAFMPLNPAIDPAASLGATSAPTPTAPLSLSAQATPAETCAPGAPRFVHGAATLKSVLGQRMGDPLECERGIDATGDTEQRTTAGLVYYRAGTNAVVFTNGWDHWAVAANGAVHWTGDEVDPPPSAERFQ
jgi:hypothetical protein